jgi:hypothetical protein
MADHVVHPTQTYFMKGRYIPDIFIRQYMSYIKKMNGVILQIDFKNAYDKVKCYIFWKHFLMCGTL